MLSIQNIVKKNRETFKDYSTSELQNLWRIRCQKAVLVIVFCLFFGAIKASFISTILAVYSILVGFSFNILFYLLTDNSNNKLVQLQREQPVNTAPGYLEADNLSNKLKQLSRELFYNVSYFNIISIALIIWSLGYFMFQSVDLHLLKSPFFAEKLSLIPLDWTFKKISIFVRHGYNAIFYFLLIESTYTFVRTISRVSFFFNKSVDETGS